MNTLSIRIFLLALSVVIGVAQAHSSVVVIPLMGENGKNLKNIITVALDNGDFSDPVAALASIPSSGPEIPSTSNRYLLVVGPGEYDLGSKQIVMQQWVSIQGAGWESTRISAAVSTGQRDDSSAVVVGADNAALTDMSIENRGGDGYSTGIYSYSLSPRLERLDVFAQGGSVINSGVQNEEAASPVMTDVTIHATGGISAVGLALHKTSSSLHNIRAFASLGSVSNTGVDMAFATPSMSSIVAHGTGGASNYGMYISQSSPVISDLVTWGGDDKQSGYGVYLVFNSKAFIRNSILQGQTNALYLDSTTTRSKVANSELVNGVNDGATGQQCRDTYSASLVDVAC